MKKLLLMALLVAPFVAVNAEQAKGKKKGEKGFISLFDGKSLKGWKVNTENPKSITVKDGNIVIDGPRAHLFYAGDVADANFKNFVFRAGQDLPQGQLRHLLPHQVPGQGLARRRLRGAGEQHPRRPEKDRWPLRREGRQPGSGQGWRVVQLRDSCEGQKDRHQDQRQGYLQLDEVPNALTSSRCRSQARSGTFALQAHDPQSVVHYRNIRVKPLK